MNESTDAIETDEARHPGRHVWGFADWYEQRCQLLALFVEGCFRLGMLALLGSLVTFSNGHLQYGDPEETVRSDGKGQESHPRPYEERVHAC